MQRVVEVVVPLGVATHATALLRTDQPRVVGGALGDQPDVAPGLLGVRVDRVDERFHEGIRARIGDRIHRIEAKRVDPEVGNPLERVLHEEVAHFVRTGSVVVEGVAPWRAVPLREVRAVRSEHVAFRTEVVVDDVEHDGQAPLMTGIDEAVQAVGAAVRRLHGVREHAVVAPIAHAGKRGDGHDLDRGDPEIAQIVEAVDGRVERARVGEGADVHLGDHVLR